MGHTLLDPFFHSWLLPFLESIVYFSLQRMILAPLWKAHLPVECHSHLGTLDCSISPSQSICPFIFLPTRPSTHHPIASGWRECLLFIGDPFLGGVSGCGICASRNKMGRAEVGTFYQHAYLRGAECFYPESDLPLTSRGRLWQTHFFPESCPEVSSAS